jgi:hypothetical protein
VTLGAFLALGIGLFYKGSIPSGSIPSQESAHAAAMTYFNLPLSFEVNQGQVDAQVKFLNRSPGYQLFLTDNSMVLSLGTQDTTDDGASIRHALAIELSGANKDVKVVGKDNLAGKSNYFIGNDKTKWVTNVPHFQKIAYEAVYPGIDLVFYGNRGELEYDFIVAPGVSPDQIQLAILGAKHISVDDTGNLVLQLSEKDNVQLKKPIIYQETEGQKHFINGAYQRLSDNKVGFELASYDTTKPLIIDPVLMYSTYLGGLDFSNESLRGIAVDATGHAYVIGLTNAANFPTTVGAWDTTLDTTISPMITDAVVTKLTPDGSALVYSTYLGGSLSENGNDIAVDSSGNAYVTGITFSSNFPIFNAADTVNPAGIQDAFVSKLDSAGSTLLYSTYLGGSTGFDNGNGIATAGAGIGYVTGTASTGFPTTANAFDISFNGGVGDAFFAKIDTNLAGLPSLVYSTYLGGSLVDAGGDVAADSLGNAYIVGFTSSTIPSFPVVGAYQPSNGGSADYFISKIDTNLPGTPSLVYSTFLGGIGAEGASQGSIAIDSSGMIYVTGDSTSINFPTTSGAYDTTFNSIVDIIISKLDPTLGTSGLLFSTYLGGSTLEIGGGIALDSSGSVYVSGISNSSDFPTVNPYQVALAGGNDFVISKFDSTLSSLLFSTYLGGTSSEFFSGSRSIGVPSSDNIYVTGSSQSSDFPVTPGVFQSMHVGSVGSVDGVVAKISIPITVAIDIKPGGDPNSINLGSDGNVPVAIFGSSTFDVSDIDINSLAFSGASVKTVGKNSKPLCSISDVNFDGFDDMVCHFLTEELTLGLGDTVGVLTGIFTPSGMDPHAFVGQDSVNIVPN